MKAMFMTRNFQLERQSIYSEIRDRLVWSDYRRVQELFLLLSNVRQDEGRTSHEDNPRESSGPRVDQSSG